MHVKTGSRDSLMLFGRILTNEQIRKLFYENLPTDLSGLNLFYQDEGEALIETTGETNSAEIFEKLAISFPHLHTLWSFRGTNDARVTGFSRPLTYTERNSPTAEIALEGLDKIVSSFQGEYSLFGDERDDVGIQLGKPAGYNFNAHSWDANLLVDKSKLTTIVYHHTNSSSNKLIQELTRFYKAR